MRLIAILLSFLIAGAGVANGQTPPRLRIVVVEGEGAINNIQLGSSYRPVVEVRDENDRPVAGAIVTFSLPERGAGGDFFGVGLNMDVTTDTAGRAVGVRYQHNFTEGRFQIRVLAVHGDRRATVNINQRNVLRSEDINRALQSGGGIGRGKMLAILSAGVIAGVIVAVTRGGDESSTPGTLITAGTVSVGTPR